MTVTGSRRLATASSRSRSPCWCWTCTPPPSQAGCWLSYASSVAHLHRLSGLVRVHRGAVGQPPPALRPGPRGRRRPALGQPGPAADQLGAALPHRRARRGVPERHPRRPARRGRPLRRPRRTDRRDVAAGLRLPCRPSASARRAHPARVLRRRTPPCRARHRGLRRRSGGRDARTDGGPRDLRWRCRCSTRSPAVAGPVPRAVCDPPCRPERRPRAPRGSHRPRRAARCSLRHSFPPSSPARSAIRPPAPVGRRGRRVGRCAGPRTPR